MERLASLALGVSLIACSGGSAPLAPHQPPAASTPASITVVSGNDREGKANVTLAEPLVVRVTDVQGQGVASVPVRWYIASGSGRLLCSGSCTTDFMTVTDGSGLTDVSFIPRAVGMSQVGAYVTLDESHATFTVEATGLVIHIGASRSWGFSIFPEQVTVPVGTTVEWWTEDIPYSITSVSVPQGEEIFVSGVLASSERFQFVPTVTGTYEYSAREYDELVPGGGAEGFGSIIAK